MKIRITLLALPFLVATTVSYAEAPNWNKIKGNEVTLFYPGQASWEWLLTKHSAAKSVRKGTPCLECHEGEEREIGALIVKGGSLEPTPIDKKPGFISANIQTAYDDNNLYLRVSWKDLEFSSNQPQQTEHQIKVAVMLDDGNVKEAKIAGCWGVCHADATNMPHFEASDKPRELYISKTREKLTRTGGGDNIIDKKQLESLKQDGVFLEYWQAKLTESGTSSASGDILEKRHQHNTSKIDAKLEKKNGTWSAVFKRPLDKKNASLKPIISGKTYTLGFAIHDDFTKGRYHYVSFGRSFSLDQSATSLTAVKIKH